MSIDYVDFHCKQTSSCKQNSIEQKLESSLRLEEESNHYKQNIIHIFNLNIGELSLPYIF